MPIKLIVALALLTLATALQFLAIFEGGASIPSYVNLGLKLFLVIGLLRGSESARGLAVVVGVLNLLVGVLAVFKVGALFTALPLWLQLQLLVPAVFGAYLLWCMRQDDVKAWVYRRAYGEFGG